MSSRQGKSSPTASVKKGDSTAGVAPSDEGVVAVILDNGTATVKAGFGGEDAPRAEVPNVVGKVRHPGLSGIGLGHDTDNYCGPEAIAHRGLLSLTSPMERRRIVHWQEMEQLWLHTFSKALQVSAQEFPVLISEAPCTSRVDREKVTEMMFESFNAPALVVANQLALSLFATGRSTGLVVESGASRTDVGAVWEGYTLPHYVTSLDLGGDDVTQFLFDRLRREGYPFSTKADWELVQDMKHQHCYQCAEPKGELEFCKESRSVERLYDLPDGQQIYLNDHRFMSPEVLFSPTVLGNPNLTQGLHSVIFSTIQKCHPDIQPELYSSVVLAGGNTLFPKLDERVQREVSYLAPKGITVKCVSFPERKYAAWLGGSILGSLSTFPCMWVSKTEYDDYGASIIHRKA
jgi:actin